MELSTSLALPISGAKFPNQIWLALKLLALGYKPDRILGTSGGCITGTILLLADVQSVCCAETYREFVRRVDVIIGELDSSWYLKPWSSNILVDRAMGMSNCAMFNRGNGEELVAAIPIDLDSQPEMWIGTKNRTKNIHQLFCTRSRESAEIQVPGAIYAAGDVKLITKAAIASCSVPTIVPNIAIGNDSYCDGGISHASPLGPLACAYNDGQVSYHVVYISPVRYNKKDDPHTQEIEDDDVWNRMASSMAGMVGGLHIPDRNNGIRMVGPNAQKAVGHGKAGLSRALKRQQTSLRSFIEITPITPLHCNFTNMKKGDVLRTVRKARCCDDFVVRHWYVPA